MGSLFHSRTGGGALSGVMFALLAVGCSSEDPEVTATGTTGGAPGVAGAASLPTAGATMGSSGSTASSGGAGGSEPAPPVMGGGAAGMAGSGGVASGGEVGTGGAAGAPDIYREEPGTEGDGDIVIRPGYPTDPDLEDQGNPEGQRFQFSMALADSEIFKGDDVTLDSSKDVRDARRIDVYVPAAYQDGTSAPVLLIFDGPGQFDMVKNALDNLTISEDPNRHLPPFVVIAIQNGGSDSKGSERGLEYDTMSDRHARFLNDEVLPAVLDNPEVKATYPNLIFTDNPWGRATLGCSSGGAAALTAAWFRPDLFRRVVAYSATLVDQQDDDAPEEAEFPLGAWDYHSGLKLIENTELKPLRIFHHVSENDIGAGSGEGAAHDWVMAGQRTAAALKAQDYHYRFVFSEDSGHCARDVIAHTLADTLVWLWRGYHQE